MAEPTTKQRSADGKAVKCSDLLYGVVKWLDGHPLLDGMPYFNDVKAATKYALRLEKIGKATGKATGVDVRYTIIKLRKAIKDHF